MSLQGNSDYSFALFLTHWAIITGEYPPQSGGVADYTRLVATGLAATGDLVTVYAPPAFGAASNDPGVVVVRLPDRFGPRGLAALDYSLRRRPDCILVQYVPHMYGWKAMNLPFAAWVATRAAPVWVMFHEVMSGAQGIIRNAVLSRVTRQMARLVARSADRVFVSIPAWGDLLREISHTSPLAEWSPVPSNVPTAADPTTVDAARALVPINAAVIGHFGTFSGMNAQLVGPLLAVLLRRSPDRVAFLIGRGGDRYCDRFAADHPDLVGRVVATGQLPAAAAAAFILACDILVQPYPDGISSRRGSAMAGLALGVPTVTNVGFLSESVWGTESAGVSVANSPNPADMLEAAESLLSLPPDERAALGRAAAAWYRSRFAIEHTIARLRAAAPFSSGSRQL